MMIGVSQGLRSGFARVTAIMIHFFGTGDRLDEIDNGAPKLCVLIRVNALVRLRPSDVAR